MLQYSSAKPLIISKKKLKKYSSKLAQNKSIYPWNLQYNSLHRYYYHNQIPISKNQKKSTHNGGVWLAVVSL